MQPEWVFGFQPPRAQFVPEIGVKVPSILGHNVETPQDFAGIPAGVIKLPKPGVGVGKSSVAGVKVAPIVGVVSIHQFCGGIAGSAPHGFAAVILKM